MTSNVFQISDLALVKCGLKVGAPEGLKRLIMDFSRWGL